jgi:soluble lytic murein transglycosylase-like protein
LIRCNLVIGIFALSLLSFTVYAQSDDFSSARKVTSLTTTDLVNSQDFAPKVVEVDSTRKRKVTDLKRGKKGFDTPESSVVATAPVMEKKPELNTGVMMSAVASRPKMEMRPIEVSTNNKSVDALIETAAARNGIDKRLMMAVMKQESSFNPRATSYKGACGLMQLMPATAARFGVRNIYDPEQNIEGGARYLRFLLDTFGGSVELALAGYNAGEGAVMKYGNRIPPYAETQDYVRKISAHYARLTNGEFVRTTNVAIPVPSARPKYNDTEIIAVGRTMTQF